MNVLTVFAYALVLAIVLAVIYTYTGDSRVSGRHAGSLIRDGTVKTVVDVRTETEYAMGHYPGAINIPIGQIGPETAKLVDKTGGVIVYCNTGQRARYGANKFKKLGFETYYIGGTYRSIV